MREIQRLPGGGLTAYVSECEFKRARTFWHLNKQRRIDGALSQRDGSVKIFAGRLNHDLGKEREQAGSHCARNREEAAEPSGPSRTLFTIGAISFSAWVRAAIARTKLGFASWRTKCLSIVSRFVI
jgi:hypothetical protein